jgi:hypothetical protein
LLTVVATGARPVIPSSVVTPPMFLCRLIPGALATLALVGLLLSVGSVPHAHTGHGVGLYNQEHDLTLHASLTAQGTLADAPPVLTIEAVERVASSGRDRPALAVARAARSRAPPVR